MFNRLAMAVLATAMMAAPTVYAEMKIVVLDPVRAILESDEGKVLIEAANKEMQADSEQLRSQAEELQALQAKLKKDG
jgi:Skp family chaperone for outer membrane proteins